MKHTLKMAWLAGIVGLLTAGVGAQESELIYLGGTSVARIRTKGKFPSLYDRAHHINCLVNDLISTKDTENPKTYIKKVDGRWTVFAWDKAVLSVYPEEAKANGVDAKTLASIWKSKLHSAFPKCTPVSKMAKPFGDYSPTKPRTHKTPAGVEGSRSLTGGVTPAAVGGSRTTTPRTGGVRLASNQPSRSSGGSTPTAGGPLSVAPDELVVILDAFNTVRSLTEAEYAGQREQLGANLLARLRPFVLSKRSTAKLIQPVTGPSTTVPTKPAPKRAPATVEVTVPAPKPAAPPRPVAKPPVPPVPAAKVRPAGTIAAGTANLAIKQRINKKFELAEKPYGVMKSQNHPDLDRVSQLLSTARKAFFANRFPESESALDQALNIMGVQP